MGIWVKAEGGSWELGSMRICYIAFTYPRRGMGGGEDSELSNYVQQIFYLCYPLPPEKCPCETDELLLPDREVLPLCLHQHAQLFTLSSNFLLKMAN